MSADLTPRRTPGGSFTGTNLPPGLPLPGPGLPSGGQFPGPHLPPGSPFPASGLPPGSPPSDANLLLGGAHPTANLAPSGSLSGSDPPSAGSPSGPNLQPGGAPPGGNLQWSAGGPAASTADPGGRWVTDTSAGPAHEASSHRAPDGSAREPAGQHVADGLAGPRSSHRLPTASAGPAHEASGPAVPEAPAGPAPEAGGRRPADPQYWMDEDAGPLVRPYAVTRGRVDTGADGFDLLAYVFAARVPDHQDLGLGPEHRAILALTQEPISVAEVATGVNLALGVVRVLLGDLLQRRLISMHQPAITADRPSVGILREVIDGLRAL